MMLMKESHIARLIHLQTVINALAPGHIDVCALAAQFDVRPNTIRSDLSIIRKVGLHPDDNDKLCRLVYGSDRAISERYRAKLARLHAIIDIFATEHVDIFTLAVRFDVGLDTISRDLRLLRSLELLPIDKEHEICELCHEPRELIAHHWTDESGFHTKSLCYSCNAKLGHIFKGNYPTWEEQVKALNKQLVGGGL